MDFVNARLARWSTKWIVFCKMNWQNKGKELALRYGAGSGVGWAAKEHFWFIWLWLEEAFRFTVCNATSNVERRIATERWCNCCKSGCMREYICLEISWAALSCKIQPFHWLSCTMVKTSSFEWIPAALRRSATSNCGRVTKLDTIENCSSSLRMLATLSANRKLIELWFSKKPRLLISQTWTQLQNIDFLISNLPEAIYTINVGILFTALHLACSSARVTPTTLVFALYRPSRKNKNSRLSWEEILYARFRKSPYSSEHAAAIR